MNNQAGLDTPSNSNIWHYYTLMVVFKDGNQYLDFFQYRSIEKNEIIVNTGPITLLDKSIDYCTEFKFSDSNTMHIEARNLPGCQISKALKVSLTSTAYTAVKGDLQRNMMIGPAKLLQMHRLLRFDDET